MARSDVGRVSGPPKLFVRGALAALVALWSVLVAGMFGELSWRLDVLAQFRIHYLALFALLLIACAVMRQLALAAAAGAGLLVCAWPVAPYFMVPAAAEAIASRPLRVVTLNVFVRNPDIDAAAEFLRRSDADVLVLQEASNEHLRTLRRLLPDHPYVHATPGGYGAVILSRQPFATVASPALASHGAQGAYVELDWAGARIAVLGVHLHWPLAEHSALLRNEELRGLAEFARARQAPLLVAGDFNITPWSPLFTEMLAASGLRDCARGQGLETSWPSQALWLGIRIDQCLASDDWVVRNLRIGPHVGSDHRPVMFEATLQRLRSGAT